MGQVLAERGALRVSAVSYLNTLPMISGLRKLSEIDLRLEHPADCAKSLIAGEVDIALCPVGALIGLPEYHIVSNYGIGCNGKVRTVAVYSERPLNELRAIRLYGESRTSNLLVQVLDANYWKLGLDFQPDPQLDSDLVGSLVIGDACFERESNSSYITDLGVEWHHMTGLPFVFASWASLSPVSSDIVEKFDQAIGEGLEGLDTLPLPALQKYVDLRSYLRENIRYAIDDYAREAIVLFTHYARQLIKPKYHAG